MNSLGAEDRGYFARVWWLVAWGLGVATSARASIIPAATAARLSHTTDYALNPDSVFHTLPMDNIDFNNTGWVSPTTVQQAGLYEIDGSLTVRNNALTGTVQGQLLVNGTAVDQFFITPQTTSGPFTELPFAAVTNLNSGAVVSVQLESTPGAGLTVSAFSNLNIVAFNGAPSNPAAGGYRAHTSSSAQFIAGSIFQNVAFAVGDENSLGIVNSGGNMTAAKSGLYQIKGTLNLDNEGSSLIGGRVLVNGVVVDQFIRSQPIGGGVFQLPFSSVASVHAGDAVAVQIASLNNQGVIVDPFSTVNLVGFNASSVSASGSTADGLRANPSIVRMINPDSAFHTVNFDQVVLNTTSGTATTAGQSGLYEIDGALTLLNQNSQGQGPISGRVTVNGVTIDSFFTDYNFNSGYIELPFSTVGSLNAGDTIAVQLENFSGAPLTVDPLSNLNIVALNNTTVPEPCVGLISVAAVMFMRRAGRRGRIGKAG